MAEEKMQTARIYKTTTSFSHVLGNLTVIVEDYIKSIMPKNYFKQSRATTEVAFKDHNDFRRNMISAEKPYLVLDPKFIVDQESESLPQVNWDRFIPTEHHSNASIYFMNHEFFLKHPTEHFGLGYTFNRYKLQFGITMIVDTQMLQLALINYLRSNFRFRHYIPIRRYTETLIPKAFVEYMSDKLEMDINSSDFISEINKHSQRSILRLHRPATDKSEFFVLSPTDIQIRFPDYPSEDVNRAGRVQKSSSVNFMMEVELNVMNSFLLLTEDIIDVPDSDLSTDYMVRISIESRTPILDKISGNRTLYTKIAVEFDNTEEDIDLKKFVGSDILNVIQYMQDHQLDDDYANILVYKWNDQIDVTDPTNGEVDYSDLTIKLKNLEKETVYHIFIYIDMNYVKEISRFINAKTLNTIGSDYE